VVTGSHDKSIRIWEKTDEPLFLEEERERDIEALYDSNIADGLNAPDGREDGDEVEAVQKQTSETLMAGERIMEALDLADADRAALREWEEEKTKFPDAPRPTRNAELVLKGDLAAEEHVLRVIQKIPAASMEDALLVLPFRQVVSLLGYLDEWARKVSQTYFAPLILSRTVTSSSPPDSSPSSSVPTRPNSSPTVPSALHYSPSAPTSETHCPSSARSWGTTSPLFDF